MIFNYALKRFTSKFTKKPLESEKEQISYCVNLRHDNKKKFASSREITLRFNETRTASSHLEPISSVDSAAFSTRGVCSPPIQLSLRV